ncbi:uncharacterized protein LOC142057151 [Phalacrocorax aristotelis]|uniref:uncharacterized protein LOC142057151 n=1 Tax=Phalacrocorax aristotelis TaxID=126867 RepID=UPI003F4B3C3C
MQASEGRRRMPTRGPRGCAPAAFGPGCAFEMTKRQLVTGGVMCACPSEGREEGDSRPLERCRGRSRAGRRRSAEDSAVSRWWSSLNMAVGPDGVQVHFCLDFCRCRNQPSEGRRRMATRGPRRWCAAAFGTGCAFEMTKRQLVTGGVMCACPSEGREEGDSRPLERCRGRSRAGRRRSAEDSAVSRWWSSLNMAVGPDGVQVHFCLDFCRCRNQPSEGRRRMATRGPRRWCAAAFGTGCAFEMTKRQLVTGGVMCACPSEGREEGDSRPLERCRGRSRAGRRRSAEDSAVSRWWSSLNMAVGPDGVQVHFCLDFCRCRNQPSEGRRRMATRGPRRWCAAAFGTGCAFEMTKRQLVTGGVMCACPSEGREEGDSRPLERCRGRSRAGRRRSAEDSAVSRWWSSLNMAVGPDGVQVHFCLDFCRCRNQPSEGRRRMATRGPRRWCAAAFGTGCAFEMTKRQLVTGGVMCACPSEGREEGDSRPLERCRGRSRAGRRRSAEDSAVSRWWSSLNMAVGPDGVQVHFCLDFCRCRNQPSEGRRRMATRGPRRWCAAAFGTGCAFEGPQGRTTV